MLMFCDLAERHGCRDLGLVRVLRAKVQPPDIPVSHVSPRFCQREPVNESILPLSSQEDRTD